MLKKDLGLLVLIILVGAVVTYFNPLFLSPLNIANTANLVGLYGLLSIAAAFVIITGGIDLSIGSMIALLGVIFIDLIANRAVPWPVAIPIVLALSFLLGLIHGLLIGRIKLQPFVVTLCGLLIYRSVARFYTNDGTAGFPFGVSFPDLKFLTAGRTDIVALVTGGSSKLAASLSIGSYLFLAAVILAIVVAAWPRKASSEPASFASSLRQPIGLLRIAALALAAAGLFLAATMLTTSEPAVAPTVLGLQVWLAILPALLLVAVVFPALGRLGRYGRIVDVVVAIAAIALAFVLMNGVLALRTVADLAARAAGTPNEWWEVRIIPIPHSFIFMIAVAIVMWVVLHRSVFGRYLYAVGKNEEAARYSGIRTTRVIIAAYVICAVLTGLSAIFFAMYVPSILPSSHGNFYELYAIAAAVLGGFSLRGGEGSIIGVVLGTILLRILQNLVNMLGIPSSLDFAVMGSVILIGVLADQQFGRYRERRRTLEAARLSAQGQPKQQPAE